MKEFRFNAYNLFAVVVSITTICAIAHGDTIAVPKDAATIQEAIDQAQGDDLILVSPGRYNESINFNGKAITLKSTDGAAVTTIDGWDKNDSVVKCISGEGPSTILDGFTITGGTGNTELFSKSETVGGGLFCMYSSPTVLNCIFVSNSATYQGGGIYNGDRSNTVIRNCKIISNVSERGGGVYNSRGTPEIRDTEISDNTAKFGGGGMYNFGSYVQIVSCVFKHNRAEYNGGGIYDYDSRGTMTATVFTDNLAMFSGSAVYRGYRSALVIGEYCQFTMPHDTVSGTGGYRVARGRSTGACCIGTGCLIVDESACVKAGGTWLGPNSPCDDLIIACPKPNSGDINTDGVVDMMDLVLVMTSMQDSVNK
jgi:predicted outer membrane repeat protein